MDKHEEESVKETGEGWEEQGEEGEDERERGGTSGIFSVLKCCASDGTVTAKVRSRERHEDDTYHALREGHELRRKVRCLQVWTRGGRD